MGIITKLFSRKPPHQEILNIGLAMAIEFGDEWLKPINDRLKRKFRYLSATELDTYNTVCQDAMKQSNDFIYNTLDQLAESNKTIKDLHLQVLLQNYIRGQFDWIGKHNLQHLYNQGCYYASKDGLTKAIVE